MKTNPNEKADQVVNEVTVGSVVSRIAARATVSFNVFKTAVPSVSGFSFMIFGRRTVPLVSCNPRRTMGIVAPLIIS